VGLLYHSPKWFLKQLAFVVSYNRLAQCMSQILRLWNVHARPVALDIKKECYDVSIPDDVIFAFQS